MQSGWKFVHIGADGAIRSDHGSHVWKIGEWAPPIDTPILCKRGYHHSPDPLSALNYVRGNAVTRTEARGAQDLSEDKSSHADMRLTRVWRWTLADSLALAIFVAESVLPLFEQAYPADSRPRAAIKAAKAYKQNPLSADAYAAASAADAAYADAYAADAYAAADAAYAAASAAYAAATAAAAAAYAAASAAYAAASAADAAYAYAAYAAATTAADAAYAAAAAAASDACTAAYADATYAARTGKRAEIAAWMMAYIESNCEEIIG